MEKLIKGQQNFWLYKKLSQFSFLKKSYARKFLFVAFIGTHIPLLGIIAVAVYQPDFLSPSQLLITALILTLVAAGFTLYVLNKLLAPVLASERSLRDYYTSRKVPTLPVNYTDEAGALMRHLQEAVVNLEKHLEDKSDMAAMLSHDLRTPFIQFAGILGLIKEEEDSKQINKLCEMMIVENEKHLKFLEGTLDKLRADYEEESIEKFVRILSSEIIGSAVNSTRCQAAKKGVKVNCDIESDVLLFVHPERAMAAVQNLLDNAIKFSHPGGMVSVIVTAENDFARISVIDHGVGFDDSTARILFTKFAKGQAGTRGESTTGFGLYSAKKNIESFGGKISGDSKGAGQGARFEIVLPTQF